MTVNTMDIKHCVLSAYYRFVSPKSLRITSLLEDVVWADRGPVGKAGTGNMPNP